MIASLASMLSLLVSSTLALPSTNMERDSGCHKYVILSTRGTGVPQGPEYSAIEMIAATKAAVPDGAEYDVVYPASQDQNSTAATIDIQHFIGERLDSCPGQEYVLVGYSQGAAATVNTLKVISASSAMFAPIRAVVLMGDPEHRPGKHANVDEDGGHTNNNATGSEHAGTGIPTWWDDSGKVMDICYKGDGVCSGDGITPQHHDYANNTYTQTMASKFMIEKLQ